MGTRDPVVMEWNGPQYGAFNVANVGHAWLKDANGFRSHGNILNPDHNKAGMYAAR
jgi:hypothetical protein